MEAAQIEQSRPTEMTDTQKAAVTEGLVAAMLVAASDGRLSPFTPMADDHGVDLIVFDKASGATAPVQVKSWLTDTGWAQFDVRKATFRPSNNSLLLCVAVDAATLGLRLAWLLPMAEVPSRSTEKADKYALTQSFSQGSKDRYVPFRRGSAKEIADEMIRLMTASR